MLQARRHPILKMSIKSVELFRNLFQNPEKRNFNTLSTSDCDRKYNTLALK
jgi:hypothetical protein